MMEFNWQLCRDAGPFDFHDSCVRSSWSALLPAAFVFFLCLFSIPVPRILTRFFAVLKSPFEPYLNLHEAEALDVSAGTDYREVTADADRDANTVTTKLEIEVPDTVPLWRTVVFAFVGLVEALCWLSYGSYNLINLLSDSDSPIHPDFLGLIIPPFLIAISWVYAVVRPVVWSTATPPYDLFVVYSAHLVMGILLLGGELFDCGVAGSTPPLLAILALSANLAAVMVLLVVLGNMPLGVPSNQVKNEEIVSFIFLCLCTCGGSVLSVSDDFLAFLVSPQFEMS